MAAATPETSTVSVVAPGVRVTFNVPVLFSTTSTCCTASKARGLDRDLVGADRQVFEAICAGGAGIGRDSGAEVGGFDTRVGDDRGGRINNGADEVAADGLAEGRSLGAQCDQPQQSKAERGRF